MCNLMDKGYLVEGFVFWKSIFVRVLEKKMKRLVKKVYCVYDSRVIGVS